MTDTDWPFGDDADRDDPLTALRIPVTSTWPGWSYIAAFDRGSDARPTDGEARMIASFIREYVERWYNDTFKARLAERPLDVDGGANTTIFRKYADGDWGYRRRTWTIGPCFVPETPRVADRKSGPLTLEQVMDREYSYGGDGEEPREHWVAWKAQHPDVFGTGERR